MDSNGNRVSDPGVLDEMLWASRSRLWPAAAAGPGKAQSVISQYAHGRTRSCNDITIPGRRQIAQQILRAGGAATGIDGKPYEVINFGVEFTVCLLGQAFHAASTCEASICLILRPAQDLLVWIPKKAGADTADEQRPLQLPPCFHRLFAASLIEVVGPVVEQRLTPHQAGIRGGACGQNVRRAYRHLRGDEREPSEEPDWEMLGVLLRDLVGPIRAIYEEYERHPLREEPAILFADQEKAFERIGHR